ncbi:MAG: mucoidy inhibitor MuiA family protein, partial [Leptospira sp.]|nr:mucoidy inhibitor MuiA family protein [Leptospira sp.]
MKQKLNMKLFLSATSIFLGSLFTQPITGESSSILAPIQEVVVYSDRALVTRNFQVNLTPGKHTLRFINGNADLDPYSLRAESKNSNTTVVGIQSFLEMSKESNSQEIRKLEQDIRKLENRENSLKLSNDRLNKDLAGIQEYSKFLTFYISEASVQDGSDNGNWNDGLKVLSKRRNETKNKIQSNDTELVALKKKLDMQKKKLNQIQSRSNKSHRVIEVTLQTTKNDNANVNFSYMVPNAGWNVSYGMHLDDKNQIRIEYYGNIKQETGEDWKDVNLYLSTAKPSLGGKRYPLQSVKIRVFEVKTEDKFVQSQKMSEMMMDEEESSMSAGASGVSDGAMEPALETGGFSGVKSFGESLQFRIPKKVTIPTEKR